MSKALNSSLLFMITPFNPGAKAMYLYRKIISYFTKNN
nr:MAG TPA: hypothetical protein [Caudoviricetes sp.]